jgi:nitrate/nitrite transport system substrate-binding protein
MTSVVLLFTGCHPSPPLIPTILHHPHLKTSLKIGFIKLTDMAPLAIAAEKGFLKTKGYKFNLRQPN